MVYQLVMLQISALKRFDFLSICLVKLLPSPFFPFKKKIYGFPQNPLSPPLCGIRRKIRLILATPTENILWLKKITHPYCVLQNKVEFFETENNKHTTKESIVFFCSYSPVMQIYTSRHYALYPYSCNSHILGQEGPIAIWHRRNTKFAGKPVTRFEYFKDSEL